MEEYYEIDSPSEGEYTDRKSRFIGHAFPVRSEKEALVIIDQVKRKYWDARHNCHAYVLGDNTSRFSDDGEPSGTAGRPILEVLNGANVRNIVVVVTRYFGGTLLGTGGLIKAYTEATKEALGATTLKRIIPASKVEIVCDYNDSGKLKHYFETGQIRTDDTAYTDVVTMRITVSEDTAEDVITHITQITSGKARVRVLEKGFFAL